jgi:hypothetical protein
MKGYKSAIKEIFYGQRGIEFVPQGEEYSAKLEALVLAEEEMEQKTKELPEWKALFEKVKSAFEDLGVNECDAYYFEGFRLGVLVGLDVAGFIKEE